MKDIVRILSKSLDKSNKEIENYLTVLQEVIEDGLFDDKIVKISGLGSFKMVWNKPRKSVNVRTGESMEIAGHYKLNFIPESSLCEKVNMPYAHLEMLNLDEGDINSIDEQDLEPLGKLAEQARELSSVIEEINKPQDIATNIATSDSVCSIEQIKTDENVSDDIDTFEVKNLQEENNQNLFGTNDLNSEVKDDGNNRNNKKNRSKLVLFVSMIFVLISIIPIYLLFVNKPVDNIVLKSNNPEDVNAKEDINIAIIDSNSSIETEKLEEDTIILLTYVKNKKPKSIENTKKSKIEITAQVPSSSKNPNFDRQRVYKEFSDTVLIAEGSRLAWISYKEFKHKAFWVYIYEANRDHIFDPNDIPVGTAIRIPVLSSELIDVNSDECIEYAKELYHYYVKK